MATPDYYEPLAGMRQFLSFFLDDEVFALDVSRIREVLDQTELTRVPRMPPFMRGVLNLRGSVVPVVDMRVRFGMGRVVETLDTCIIVAEIEMDGEITVLGAMVDGVNEVFELAPDDLEAPPKMGAKLPTEFIEAMGRHDDGFIIILNADRVFSTDEIIAVRDAATPAAPAKPAASRKKTKE